MFHNEKIRHSFRSLFWIECRGFQAKIKGVKGPLGVEGGRGVIVVGGYQPFLEKTAGMVRINIYRFRSSDLFCI
jgi:hypothetical protein